MGDDMACGCRKSGGSKDQYGVLSKNPDTPCIFCAHKINIKLLHRLQPIEMLTVMRVGV